MAANGKNKRFFFSSDFKETVKNYYYVDKSLLIKDLIDGHSQVSLITRPRRFGKSLNMDMIKTFFEKTEEDTSVYFRNLRIWECGDKYTSEQGKYPVIHLNLKECESKTYEGVITAFKDTLAVEFARHRELGESEKVDRRHDLKMYEKISCMDADIDDLRKSLALLSRMLYAHYGVKPIILIDEYDVPIQKGYDNGYFSDVIDFMRDFFTMGLKDNPYLNFAILTGVTRISQASLFSGLNNLEVYSVLDDRYSEYYGFTKDEVRAMLRDFDAEDKFGEVCEWYDGYLFGNTEVFNPRSVDSYISRNFTPAPYWANTSYSGALKAVLDNISDDDADNFELLSSGKKIRAKINDNIPYNELWHGENVYTMLLSSGYLTKGSFSSEEGRELGDDEQWLVIPNNEVRKCFCSEILGYANSRYGGAGDYSKKLLSAMEKGDAEKVQACLTGFMQKSMSVRNRREDFYHGMVFGLIGNLGRKYSMVSDREYEDGFPDIAMEPFGCGLGSGDVSSPCIVLEFKYCGKADRLDGQKMTAEEYGKEKTRLMRESAGEALGQAEKRDYVRDFRGTHTRILKYGIAFYGKEAYVLLSEETDRKEIRRTAADGTT